MNIRYYHDFIGDDDVLNRFEILTDVSATSKAIEATRSPFVLEYQEVKKLDPIRGAQATLGLISESNFQYTDLHTDDMQEYLVKFYRKNKLYWIGWLDAELYNEQLSAIPPYAVEFSAADFNILERLKYRDASENKYSDIAPLITHLKRCFAGLNLPFQKLYIGCSTVANGVTMANTETLLHVLYVMSGNFYDEDNEPMTCREVVESILRPFGLMMVQKDANVYIYDYNTVKQGLPLKRYDFETFIYESDEDVSFDFGNLVEIGFASTEGDYGFEEMINNVTITSSLYAAKSVVKNDVSEKTLSEKKTNEVIGDKYKIEYYAKDENIESLNASEFVIYTNTDSNATMEGMLLPYDPDPSSVSAKFKIKGLDEYIFGNPNYYINIKAQAYANTRDNPFDSNDNPKDDISDAKVLFLKCNLYFVDVNGTPSRYYSNTGILSTGWWPISDYSDIPQGRFELFFTPDKDTRVGNALNTWITNSDIAEISTIGESYPPVLQEKNFAKGQNVKMFNATNGYIVFEITNKCYIYRAEQGSFYPYKNVKNIIVNDLEISIKNAEKEDITTDDYEFKSYVNKKVASDFGDLTLKCISANEEKIPIGKGNILKLDALVYEGIVIERFYAIHTSFTRSGQTDILERLLMCTIHSNFATKNEKMMVDIKMTDNPALSFVSCTPILSNSYLVVGCSLDFHTGKTTISAVGYSDDVAKLSSIPYD